MHTPKKVSKHNILTIPTELFDIVVEHVSPQDLCALRLVSKEAAARILKAYTAAHFTERSSLLYKDSLQTLADIADSEYFGRQVKSIVLCVDEPAPPPVQDWSDSKFERALIEIYDDDIGAIDVARALRPYLKKELGTRPPKPDLREKVDYRFLETVFRRFRRIGVLPTVRLTNIGQDSRPPCGSAKLRADAGAELKIDTVANGSKFIGVITALMSSNIRVTEFDVTPEHTGGLRGARSFGVPLYTIIRKHSIRAYVVSVFRHLRKLKISIAEDEDHNYEGGRNAEKDADNLVEVLEHSPLLEEFVLFQDARNGGLTPSLHLHKRFFKLRFPALRYMAFVYCEIDLPDLRDFVLHQPRLEEVVVEVCMLAFMRTHPQEHADGKVDSVARRIRGESTVKSVKVICSGYYLEEDIDCPWDTTRADSLSSVDREIPGLDVRKGKL